MSKSRFSWKKALHWARVAPGLPLLVDIVSLADEIRARSLELPGPSELPKALLLTLGLALQTKPWNVAGILALFILWLLLHILDRRLGDYRPVGDYWGHSVAWIVYYLFMVDWELVKLMIPSISKVPGDLFIWAWLVVSLIVDYSLWVVALGPDRLKFDRLNWHAIDLVTVAGTFLIVTLVELFQGKSSPLPWLLAIYLLLGSTALILRSLYGGFPAPRKYRWIRWVFLGAVAVTLFLFSFFEQIEDGDSSVIYFLFALISVIYVIGAIALIADSALRFSSRRRRHQIDKINYRYRLRH